MEHISRLWVCSCYRYIHIKRKQNARPPLFNILLIFLLRDSYRNAFLVAYITRVSRCKDTIFFGMWKKNLQCRKKMRFFCDKKNALRVESVWYLKVITF